VLNFFKRVSPDPMRNTSPPRGRGLRRSEIVLILYYLYAAAVALALPIAPELQRFCVLLNFSIAGFYLFLAGTDGLRTWTPMVFARDWLPLGLIILAYRQMGWFAPEAHTFELEGAWIVWDRLLLYDWGVKALIEALGPLLPSLLEISYSLVYPMGPAALVILYCIGQRRLADRYLLLLLLGTVSSYALFPYFISEPPRTVFAGEDLPSYATIFRRFNLWMLSGTGIHTSVFPSAHVSTAFSAAFGLMRLLPQAPWIGRAYFLLASLIFWATIYGRYHYAVDAAAGLAVAAGALGVTVLVERAAPRWIEQTLRPAYPRPLVAQAGAADAGEESA